jgi:hypothetical protein
MAWTVRDVPGEWIVIDATNPDQSLFRVTKNDSNALQLLRLLMAAPALEEQCRGILETPEFDNDRLKQLSDVLEFLDSRVDPEIPHYEVVVGNVGRVYVGYDGFQAAKDYRIYVNASELQTGRAGGEDVTLLRNGVISRQHIGKNNEEND